MGLFVLRNLALLALVLIAAQTGDRIGLNLEPRDMDLGRLDPAMELKLFITSANVNLLAAEKFVGHLREPSHPEYGRYITPTIFANRFGPSEAVYRQMQKQLVLGGLKIDQTYPDRVLVKVEGTVAQIQNLLGVELHEFQRGERFYFASLNAPVVPPTLHGLVEGVVGLSGWMRGPVENFQLATATPNLAAALTPSQIKKIYGMDSIAEDGRGQTLAILDYDGFLDSDIQAYINKFSITNPAPRELVTLDGFNGVPTGGSSQGETTLDVEMAYAIAPHLSKILIYEVPNSAAALGFSQLLTAAANDNRAQVVSMSLGHPEPATDSAQIQLENTLLIQLATQGTSVFIASGDSGAFAGTTGSVAVANPGVQPYCTSVGGTSVRYDANSVYTSETSWANSATTRGGGGGISTIWPIPSWQAGLGTKSNLGSAQFRMIPDVSLNADGLVPYYYILKGVQGTNTGGTSFAAPLWAAYATLINQRRQANGLPRLGFATPALYQVARSSIYASAFHDINDGSTNLFYPTTTGYDLSSGWGSPKGSALIQFLASATLPPQAPTNLSVSFATGQ